jgi:hypothetical protein
MGRAARQDLSESRMHNPPGWGSAVDQLHIDVIALVIALRSSSGPRSCDLERGTSRALKNGDLDPEVGSAMSARSPASKLHDGLGSGDYSTLREHSA